MKRSLKICIFVTDATGVAGYAIVQELIDLYIETLTGRQPVVAGIKPKRHGVILDLDRSNFFAEANL